MRNLTYVPNLFWLHMRMQFDLTKPNIKMLGLDLAGEIEAVGKDVKRFKKGDQVFETPEPAVGAHAQYICILEDGVLATKAANLPANIRAKDFTSPRKCKKEKIMNSSRKTATLVGALFLVSNVTFLLGAFVFVEPVLGAPDYLTLVSENSTQVISGALLEIMNGVAYVGIGVLMFPIFRRRFESMALWYVGFRVIEFVMQTLSDLSPLSLVRLSEEFVMAGAPEASSFEAVGTLLLAERYWAFQMVTVALVLGAVMFYTMLYQTKLIPRFISIWGLIGAAVVLATAMLDTFGLNTEGLDVLGVLMLLNELFLGVWLIVKGFDSSAVASLSAIRSKQE